MEVKFKTSPNFRAGRNGKAIIAIVNHITAGLMPGCLAWMQNPDSKASSHYLITKAGEIYQLVRDQDTAWHCGIANKPIWSLYDGTNANQRTIGIEHECVGGGELTEAQYQASLWLHRELIAKHGIPIDSNHIIGHCQIDSVNRANDPGSSFPWQRLFNDLKGGVRLDIKEATQILAKNEVISNPDYWVKASEVVKYLDSLIINMAHKLS